MDARVLQNPFSKSLLLHLLLLLMFVSFSILAPKIKTEDEPIAVDFFETKKNGGPQIVAGEKDQKVKDERSARTMGVPNPIHTTPSVPTITRSGESSNSSSIDDSNGISVKDLGVRISTTQTAPQEQRHNWAAEALGEELTGGEYVEGLKEDETSALNTKENVFFSYTERMKGQLYQIWAPIIRREVERFYGMGFTLSANTHFITRTKVVINQKGEIVKVQLLQESGVVDLDDAALTALNKAGPYPNPPKGLMNANGNAELQWNFILRN